MYYVMRASAPSLHRESTDSLIHVQCVCVCVCDSIKYTHSLEYWMVFTCIRIIMISLE